MRFIRDRRGQSVVVGTVILFGFLILALALYQVQVVPQQNSQVEFQHFEEVQDDLVDVRNAISTTGSSERPQFPSVKLGPEYPTRIAAINPPDPAGSLQTSRSYDIRIEDETGETVTIPTRFIQYRPGYNELQVGSIWYDNSALYLDERDRGSRAVFIEDQNLVTDGGRLRIIAVQNEFQASGTRQVTVELYPTDDDTDLSDLSGELTVEIPTRLTEADDYWEDAIDSDTATYDGIDESAYPESDEVSALRLEVESTDSVSVNTVGIQSEPLEGSRRQNVDPDETGQNASDVGSSRAGQGGRSEWSETSTTEEVSTAGGVISRIGSINAIVLSNPRVSPINPESGEVSDDSRFFRLSFTVGDPPGSGQRYVFVFPEDPDDPTFEIENGQITAAGSVPISVFREDSNGVTQIIDEKEIRSDTLNSWYQNQVDLNLLDEGAYTEPAEVSDDLAEIREYLFENSGQEAYITDVTGRTDLTLDTRRVIDVQDDIEPGDDEFTVTTRNLEGLDEGFVIVENRDSGESTSFSSAEGDTTQIDADDVGGLEDGDEIVGILYMDNTEQTELSRDQEFVGDAPPAQFGQLEAESTTRGNSDNIDTVTFDWTSTGGVDTVTFETRTTDGGFVDGTSPTPPQEGSVSLTGANNNQLELFATIQGSGGSETCTVTITGETTVTKQDFDCTSE